MSRERAIERERGIERNRGINIMDRCRLSAPGRMHGRYPDAQNLGPVAFISYIAVQCVDGRDGIQHFVSLENLRKLMQFGVL
jgi:hypothetical protein